MIPDDYDKYNEFIMILESGIKCGFCSEPLSVDDVDMYDHDGGISVKGHLVKQWVYVRCANESCKYAWAWHKIRNRAKNMGLLKIE